MTPPGRSQRRRDIILAVLAAGSVFGIGTVLTLAAFTDNGTAESTFSTGNIDLQLNAQQGNPTPYAFSTLNMTGVGSGTTTYGNLTVSNAGTLPFGYTMSTALVAGGSADLYGALRVSVKVLTGAVCDATTYAAGPTALLNNVAFSAATLTSRPLAVAAAENLCFQVNLPADAPAITQGQTATVDFAFIATQS
ncbi:MAG: hypothetical protein H7146_09250 [Burkholderiaceae bacterium]|nr:hypothetical protein [Microbacteriaceae bacterium]